MAGWRRVSDGDDEGVEPVELVDDGDSSEREVSGGRDLDWHAVLRTGAAVLAALSLLWIGRSMADERTERNRFACEEQVQNLMWRWEEAANARGFRAGQPRIPDEVTAELADRARDCGDELFADSIDYRLRLDEED
ncbi:MAG TPA: hypothetical protein VFV42_10315 [Acidimicrobiales bacterium]|nr:hypothetical protein [Acidimicrobiales bacterium]